MPTPSKSTIWISGLITAMVLLAAAPLVADEVQLRDGSNIRGTIQELIDGELTVRTAFAGEVTIDAGQVEFLQTDEEVAVMTTGRDRIVGRLAVVDGRQMVLDTSFGALALEPQTIGAITPAEAPTPGVQDIEQQHEQQVERIEAEHREDVEQTQAEHEERVNALKETIGQYTPEWSGQFEFGLDGQTGNTETLNIRGAARALRETAAERLSLFIEGRYSEDDGDKTENEVRGGTRLEVDVSDRTFVFGEVTAEYDEFENLDLRLIATAGVGYFFIEKQRQELKGRAGLGFQHESFSDGESEREFIATLGYDYRLDINEKFRLTHSLTYYPTLDDPASDFRVAVETAGEVPISEDEAWKLRAGMRNDYDNQPPAGVEKLDTSYFLNVVYSW